MDNARCALTEGQVVFHKPMETHSHVANGQNASNIVVIAFSCQSPILSFFDKKIFSLEKSSKKILSLFLSEASNALGQLCGDYENKSPLDFSHAQPGAVQLMQCYLVEFLFSLIRTNSERIQPLAQIADVHRIAESSLADSVLHYMQANITRPPSLQLLCEQFSISRTYLCSIFKASVGTSPVDYWISLKIREAKKLIREGNLNVTQIAEYLGYAGIHHFSRMFKKVVGISPTDYRNSVGE